MPTKPTASISEIGFSGGNKFRFKPDEKVILVGPNNSGKSQSLREIIMHSHNNKNERPLVIDSVQISKTGTSINLREFLDAEAEFITGSFHYKDWLIPSDHLFFWDQPFLVHTLLAGFVKNITANERLNICVQQPSIAPNEQKSKPQHVLYDDETLMAKISLLFKRAFGKDIIFDYRGGSRMPIHVGHIDTNLAGTDRVSNSYVEEVRKNPLLDKQGDGMKSYAGILFETIAARRDVTLIDEPEAFLHPPQMRRLGETLASEVAGQLFVATHSSDILRGFLEGTKGNVRILRLRREGDVNLVFEASSDIIKELWERPELRYSNALEGIFHEQTIICEDDSDCRLINCVADYMATQTQTLWQDTSYVPTGGKHGIAKVAAVLRKIGVPVKAVFDMDFLSESSLLQETIEAFGGRWGEFEPAWNRLDAAVRSGIKAKSVAEIKSEVVKILDSAVADDLPKRAVIEAMKQGKSWAEVKKYGARGIPNGEAQAIYITLRDNLEGIGIFLIPVGEIEGFCSEIGLHGPKFVTKLISTIALGDDRLAELRTFVEKVHKGRHGLLTSSP